MNEQDIIYVDNNATTAIAPEVFAAMEPFLTTWYGNPSSPHPFGSRCAKVMVQSRKAVAELIGAEPEEIIFTSCGTESDNAAIMSALETQKGRRKIVTCAVEHPAVLSTCHFLQKQGIHVDFLSVDHQGRINLDEARAVIDDDTALVTVMWANNEIGNLYPVEELAAIAHEHGALFHTDGAQTLGKIDFDVAALGVDAASFSGHKIYGPKGTGLLYVKHGVRFAPLLTGGGQESKRRSGTSNVAGAVGLATALELMDAERPTEAPRLTALRDRLVERLLDRVEYAQLNAADAPEHLPHIANFVIPGIEGEAMLLHLDAAGIAVSTGSACSSGSLKPSHVLLSIGCPVEFAHGSLRVSLGRFTTEADVEYLVEQLVPVVDKLRSMNPLYERTVAGLLGANE